MSPSGVLRSMAEDGVRDFRGPFNGGGVRLKKTLIWSAHGAHVPSVSVARLHRWRRTNLSGDTESEISAVDFARLFHFLRHALPREVTRLMTGSDGRDTISEMFRLGICTALVADLPMTIQPVTSMCVSICVAIGV